MEAVIASVIEKSLIGGAFIYMLHFFLTKFSTSLEQVTSTLNDISNTMKIMDTRMEGVEERIQNLEERGDNDGKNHNCSACGVLSAYRTVGIRDNHS